MHFHLPKPLHGWRAFAGEVGIIVVGVLIALAAEQAVDDWQWHRKVDVVRSSLMGELGNDRARWQRDVAAARCAKPDIERLDEWAKNGASGTSPSVPTLRSGNLLSMHSANWSLATGSQALDHFPVREQIAFAALYNGLANRNSDLNNAADAMERVQTLIPLASDPDARRELREKLGDLRGSISDLIGENASYMTRHFDALGVRPDGSDFTADFNPATCGR